MKGITRHVFVPRHLFRLLSGILDRGGPYEAPHIAYLHPHTL